MFLRMRLLRNRVIRYLSGDASINWIYFITCVLFCFFVHLLYGGILSSIFFICFVVTGILYRLEDRFIYYPELPADSRTCVPLPSTFDLPYEPLFFPTGDGTSVHMFFITQPGEKAKQSPTILFLHGNAGNIGHRLDNVALLYHELQCNILMLEYRGYGFSYGTPTEEGLYMDAQAAIEFLASRTDINPDEIIVFGRSLGICSRLTLNLQPSEYIYEGKRSFWNTTYLFIDVSGGAVAIDLATRHNNKVKIWCLILENTFTNIPEMASTLLGFKLFKYLPLFLYKNKFLSSIKIHSVNVPVLFMSGMSDKLVPPRMMADLYNNCRSTCKRLVTIPDGTHNDTWVKDGYYHHIETFLNELREKPPLLESSCHLLIEDI